MPNPTSIRTARRRRIFLRVLRRTAIVAEACRAAGAANGSFYNWRHADPDFAAAWDRALADGITTLEDEAIRRARDGVEAPVFYQGKQVGTTRKYSDRLLVFLLKAHKPERYRDQLWWSQRPGRPAAGGGTARAGPSHDPDDDPNDDILPDGRNPKEMTLAELREEFLDHMARQGLAVVDAGDHGAAGAAADRSLLSGYWGASPRVLSEAPGIFPRGP